MSFRQYLRVTIGLLFIAFVVVHVESHLADFTMETSFMPILGEKKFFLILVPFQFFPGWVQKGDFFSASQSPPVLENTTPK